MAYQSSVSFSGVVLIESLHSGSWLTGTDLFETTIAPAVIANGAFAERIPVSNRAQFFGALTRAETLADAGHSPILHFEMHGDHGGLQLASKEMVDWPELAPALTRINERTRMNLLVVAAACNGWHLSEVLKPVDRAPAWGVVGPPDSVQSGDLYGAMKRFYETLWRAMDLRAALNAANQTADMDEWNVEVEWADVLYCQVFRSYLESLADEPKATRVNRLVVELARAQNIVDVNRTMQLREQVTRDLDDHQFWFDHYKSRFLMLDRFPENAGRFPLRLSDCIPT